MDSGTRTRMKRAKILAQITGYRNAQKLDRRDRLDRNLYAGSTVLFNGVSANPETCCPVIEKPTVEEIPNIHVFCYEAPCHMHQY